MSLVSSPLSNLVYSGPRVTGALECFQRIQAYLVARSRNDDRIIDHQHVSSGSETGAEDIKLLELQLTKAGDGGALRSRLFRTEKDVQIYQADFSWDRNSAATLLNVDLKCPDSSLTMIVGPVGSGKSMLLKAILGETLCVKGFIHIKIPNIAFCDAKPWICNGSIRDNICKPLPYEEEWYQTVLHACALDHDIKILPQKDLTIIGSNGMATSGGQRQRISIARAIYARKRLAIFDDVLSALDAKTSEQVFTRVFGEQGVLHRHGVTSILTTHAVKFLAFANQAIVLQDGKILEQGPPRKLQVWNTYLLDKNTSTSVLKLAEESQLAVQNNKPQVHDDPGSDESEKEMERKLGDLSVYAYYLRAAGFGKISLYFTCLVIGVFCSQFPSESILFDIFSFLLTNIA